MKVEPKEEEAVQEVEEEQDSIADMSIDGAAFDATAEDQETTKPPALSESSTSSGPANSASTSTSTVAKGKHARPEDDSATEDSTNEEEKVRKERETKAKKVKVEKEAGDEEQLSLAIAENTGGNESAQAPKKKESEDPVADSTASENSKPAVPQLTHPLPSKPVTIPTGPKTAHTSTPTQRSSSGKAQSPAPAPPPPSSRENSRLRIYFSSPIPISSSAVPVPISSLPRDRALTPKVEEGGKGEPAPTPRITNKKSDLEQAANPSKLSEKIEETREEQGDAGDVDGENVDGEDVDGEEIDGETVEEERVSEQNVNREQAEGEQEEKNANPEDVKAEGGEQDGDKEEKPHQPSQDETAEEKPTESSPAPPPAPLPLVVPPPEPTADRISISYARNTRRMVIDAEVVESVKIFRSLGKIEVVVNCQASIVGVGEQQVEDEYRICKGILVSSRTTFSLPSSLISRSRN